MAVNLNLTSFLKILIGAAIVAPVFWAISFVFPKGILGSYETILSVQQFGLLLGAIVGAAGTIVVLIVLDSRRPETGAAANFSMVNGMGSRFIGRSEPRGDGSYLTTEWFCLLWLPLFPVCNYRLIRVGGRTTLIPFLVISRQFVIKEKLPVRLPDVVKGYLITVALGCIVAIGLLLIANWA
jgi:hypothetical protein